MKRDITDDMILGIYRVDALVFLRVLPFRTEGGSFRRKPPGLFMGLGRNDRDVAPPVLDVRRKIE